MELTTLLFSTLLIFCLRIVDMTLDTIRIFYSVKGDKVKAGLIGFVESLVFIFALGKVLTGSMHPLQMVGYAGGFAMGTYMGTLVAEWLATDYILFRIISRNKGEQIAADLMKRGINVSAIVGKDSGDESLILFCLVKRKVSERVLKLIQKEDPDAFVLFESVEKAVGGRIPNFPGQNSNTISFRS
ncbi:MAG: DUF5698 domain-containing protein [Candidatus Sumerlaeia bacterium]|nr:DUF5698 domain-containing protein [Candidatus Sumerlaeia bacterium]